jgi:hypothetical protein
MASAPCSPSSSSSSDGPLTLGQTVLFKVKDAAKLEEALEQAIKGLPKLSGGDVRIRKRTYRGVGLREVIVKQQGFLFRPTYAIHDGWLAVAFFPQPIQAHVGRAKGELRSWKPSEKVKASLGRLPKEFVSISYSDPRPGLTQLLSIAPIIGGLAGRQPQPGPQLHREVNPHRMAWHSCAVFINDDVGTQIDGLAHITSGDDNHWYNGFKEADWGGNWGVRKCDATTIPPVVTRGVLIDVAGLRKVDALPAHYEITAADTCA